MLWTVHPGIVGWGEVVVHICAAFGPPVGAILAVRRTRNPSVLLFFLMVAAWSINGAIALYGLALMSKLG